MWESPQHSVQGQGFQLGILPGGDAKDCPQSRQAESPSPAFLLPMFCLFLGGKGKAGGR